jgi:hypothetical protein
MVYGKFLKSGSIVILCASADFENETKRGKERELTVSSLQQ